MNPLGTFEIGAQSKGIAFRIKPSPSGWLTHLCESSELSTVKKGPMRNVLQCRRGMHFSKGSAEHKGFFTNAPQLERKPNVCKVHAV